MSERLFKARLPAPVTALPRRPQVRRQDRNSVHDHPLWTVATRAEGVDDFEPLYGLLALLSPGLSDCVAQVLSFPFKVNLAYEVPDRLRTHATAEVHAVAILVPEAVLHLPEKLFVVHDLARL